MIVEVLLILPVFLWLVFTTMEMGHLAFRAILLHHAAYEVARVGSLTAKPNQALPGCIPPVADIQRMRSVGRRILPRCMVSARMEKTLLDPQEGCSNYDVVVTLRQAVPLVFPMTGFVLGKPRGGRARVLEAQVRMPTERPLFR